MGRMAIGATYVVPPVLTAPEIIVLFFACVTGQASLGNHLRRLVIEADYLLWIGLFNVSPAWPMASFTPGGLVFPTTHRRKFGVGSVTEVLELVFMTVFAGFAAKVISRVVACGLDCDRFSGILFDRLRRCAGGEPHNNYCQRDADQQRLDDFVETQGSPLFSRSAQIDSAIHRSKGAVGLSVTKPGAMRSDNHCRAIGVSIGRIRPNVK